MNTFTMEESSDNFLRRLPLMDGMLILIFVLSLLPSPDILKHRKLAPRNRGNPGPGYKVTLD
jgi:hypothetical protein